nr:urea ABC transporter substrate-binding protein [Streptomyces coryli]
MGPAAAAPVPHRRPPPIPVGVLHSLTGSVAIGEKPITDATLMAIDELNARGGVLGRRVKPLVVDGRSDWPTHAAAARRLLRRDRAVAVFGGYTSASRRSMVPVFEQLDGLLFYPTFYEGIEASRNVVYTGSTPNQFVTPAVKWFLDNRGRRFFLIGSDYVYPRAVNAVIRAQLESIGGTVAGEGYLPLGERRPQAVRKAVRRITAARPDAIVSTMVGDTNLTFVKELERAGATPKTMPVLSAVMGETELRVMDARPLAGNYVAMSYFQSLPGRTNRTFVDRFKRRFGRDSAVSDSPEAAYTSVLLWAQAVERAGSTDTDAVREALRGASLDSPEGTVYVDEENLHLWKYARLGRICPDGQISLVWQSETVIHPVPYSPYRRRQEWLDLIRSLYDGWGGRWDRPPGGRELPVATSKSVMP